jgi:hypothetical protein
MQEAARSFECAIQDYAERELEEGKRYLMIIFGFQLNDWQSDYLGKRLYWYRIIPGYHSVTVAHPYKPNNDNDNEWYVRFDYDLNFLNKYFPNPNITGTAEEAKRQVDDFLIRMSKLKAFL